MSANGDGLEAVIKEFVTESDEGLDLLERDLVALERDPPSRELLDEVFRAMHTIKGNGGALGFANLAAIAHAGESLLSSVRDGRMTLSQPVITALLALVDALRELLTAIDRNGKEQIGGYLSPLVPLGGERGAGGR